MSAETRDTLLHSQLQKGLRYDIMKAPVVSGAQSYKELCLASKNEEKQETELQKRVQYCRGDSNKPLKKPAGPPATATPPKTPLSGARRYYNCGSTGDTWPETVRSRRRVQASPRDWQNPHLRPT